jgi:diguanylate cyclase (GGDEF)-like protein
MKQSFPGKKPLLFSFKPLPPDLKQEVRSARAATNRRIARAFAPLVIALALFIYFLLFHISPDGVVNYPPWMIANLLVMGLSALAMTAYSWKWSRADSANNIAYLIYGSVLLLLCCSFALRDYLIAEDISAFVAGIFAVSFLISGPYAFYLLLDAAAGAVIYLGLATLRPDMAGIDRIGMAMAYCAVAFFIALVLESQRDFAAYTRALLSRANRELRALAITDHLTGAFNRLFFDEMLHKGIELARRSGRPLAILFIDLDRFKTINDDFGHEAGDRALKDTVDGFREELRDSDIVARYGGEEFCVMLPETGMDAACVIAERLRSRRETTAIEGVTRPLTMSLGVAVLEAGDEVQSLIARADKALYEAKTQGRNRWVAARPDRD